MGAAHPVVTPTTDPSSTHTPTSAPASTPRPSRQTADIPFLEHRRVRGGLVDHVCASDRLRTVASVTNRAVTRRPFDRSSMVGRGQWSPIPSLTARLRGAIRECVVQERPPSRLIQHRRCACPHPGRGCNEFRAGGPRRRARFVTGRSTSTAPGCSTSSITAPGRRGRTAARPRHRLRAPPAPATGCRGSVQRWCRDVISIQPEPGVWDLVAHDDGMRRCRTPVATADRWSPNHDPTRANRRRGRVLEADGGSDLPIRVSSAWRFQASSDRTTS